MLHTFETKCYYHRLYAFSSCKNCKISIEWGRHQISLPITIWPRAESNWETMFYFLENRKVHTAKELPEAI